MAAPYSPLRRRFSRIGSRWTSRSARWTPMLAAARRSHSARASSCRPCSPSWLTWASASGRSAVTDGPPIRKCRRRRYVVVPHDYAVSPSPTNMPEPDQMDLGGAIRRAATVLSASGIGSPRADAELLAAHVLGVPRGRLALVADLTAAQRDRLDALVARRAARVPLQH